MTTSFKDNTVSIAFFVAEQLPYDAAAFQSAVKSALAQDHPAVTEIIIVDGRGPAATRDLLPAGVDAARVRHVPGKFKNRAAMYNAALAAAKGEFLLTVGCESAPIMLRKSAVQTMVMAALRGNPCATPVSGDSHATVVGMVYSDYERVDAAGNRKDVHLLDWHEGRCRDTTDFGSVILYRTAALRELGNYDESYNAADQYDVRLRVSAKHQIAHIANRYSGALYSVAAAGQAHNVFAYLLASKETQLELERAFTEHLKQVGAYLAPGTHQKKVEYTPAEAAGFKDCVATIITPVNNRPGFIGRAIESVQAQTVQNIEMIIVVNGGESDPTCDTVRRYMPGGDKHRADRPTVRLLTVDINNLGLCFNYGLQHAKGKYYVQLDSDDRLKADAVEKIVKVFESDPTIGMVVGSYEVWTLVDDKTGALKRNEEVPVVTHDEWTADNGRNNLLRINGAGAPRAAHIKVIQDAGWFGVNDTPNCRNYGEDYDLVLRISEKYTIGRVWDPIYEVIRHSGGTDHSIDQATIDRNDNAKDHMRLEALERRRALNGANR